MSMLWFSSDYHLGHANIIEYCNRPFKNLESMNRTIIRNHNNRVKENDTVMFLGDFCFSNSKGGKEGEGETYDAQYYLDKLNGNFIFIKGNHDSHNTVKAYIKSAIIEYGGEKIFLTHKPDDCSINYNINLVGHVHDLWQYKLQKYSVRKTMLINVGVDVWNFAPININEIMKVYKRANDLYDINQYRDCIYNR